jgi:hypothetical protein
MTFGFQATQSGHGVRTAGSRAGLPGRTGPSASRTRSTVDSETCTSPSREPRWASLRWERSTGPRSRRGSRSPPARRAGSRARRHRVADRPAPPVARRSAHRRTRFKSRPSSSAARRVDQPASPAAATKSSRPALTVASTLGGTAGAQSQRAFPSCRCSTTACSATVARSRSISSPPSPRPRPPGSAPAGPAPRTPARPAHRAWPYVRCAPPSSDPPRAGRQPRAG